MIGGAMNSWGKAATAEGVKQPEEPEPGQELERLAEENEHRVEHLQGKLLESWIFFSAHLTPSMQAMKPCSRISACTQTTIALFLPHGVGFNSKCISIDVSFKAFDILSAQIITKATLEMINCKRGNNLRTSSLSRGRLCVLNIAGIIIFRAQTL